MSEFVKAPLRIQGQSRQVRRALERWAMKETEQLGRARERDRLLKKAKAKGRLVDEPVPRANPIPRATRRRNVRIGALIRMVVRSRQDRRGLDRFGYPRPPLDEISNKRAKAMLLDLYPKLHPLRLSEKWAWQIVKGIGDASARKMSQPAGDSATPG